MRVAFPLLLIASAISACATASGRIAGESEVACMHRLYDYPSRSVPFQIAAVQCSGDGPVDLTGDRYYQVLASSLNVAYVTRDPIGDSKITLTGSRIPQPTDRPVSPGLELR